MDMVSERNKVAVGKRRVPFVLDDRLIAALDALAEREMTTRTRIVVEACLAYLPSDLRIEHIES